MDFTTYQERTADTAIYPDHGKCTDLAITYTVLGLTNEAGETAGKWKKFFRDGVAISEVRRQIEAELGDVLWYAAQLATELGLDFNDVAEANIDKLKVRALKGTLGGSGDDR